MFLDRSGAAVRVWSPAKVNLFLEVLGRRPDGYHDLETLMVAVSLFDTLEFRASREDTVRLACDLPGLSTGPDNLVCRAAELLRSRCGVRAGARVVLRKRIPLAAGLAGGSGNAAATLAGLNRLWRLGLGRQELARLGAELGSDVAFFFSGPVAWCTGRGEVVEKRTLGAPLHLVLACPPVGLSTAGVYRGVSVPAIPVDGSAVQEAVRRGDPAAVGRLLHNRLQAPAEALCSPAARLRRLLEGHRPAGVQVSGSGSTVFALCRTPGEALILARALRSVTDDGTLSRVCVVRSCD